MSKINIDSAVEEIVGDPTPRKLGRSPKEGGGGGSYGDVARRDRAGV